MKTKPISLAFFSNTQARGGAEEHILTLLRGLDRKIFRLHLICSPAVAEMLRPDVPTDVALFPLQLESPFQLASVLRLMRYLRQEKVDILHSHLFCSSMFGSPIGRFCGVPVVIETPHLRECWRKGWKASFFIDRLVGRCVDFYIAVSRANGRFLIEEKELPAQKVRVVHNGCDLQRFLPDVTDRAELQKVLGFNPSDPVLVVPARLEPQKGHKVLLDALPIVRRDFPNVRLVCVGDGVLRAELEQQARNLQLTEAVRFVGYQSDMPKWLGLANLTVLPSFFEGLPLAAIESLAAERAMVATAVDGTPEVILDGETGLTVPPGNSEALAKAIGQLLGNPDLCRRYGRAGRALVLEQFTQEQQIKQMQRLYCDAMEQRESRTSSVADTVVARVSKTIR